MLLSWHEPKYTDAAMQPKTREELFHALLPNEPAFRWKQVEQALFHPTATTWEEAGTTLPKTMRATISEHLPWMACSPERVLESIKHDTYKAVLVAADGMRFESVLMANKRGQWTICVSSQIGCAMKCTFCATGAMGFKRSLTADEITDQYRFWSHFLRGKPHLPQRISNVVFMGMGEPMTNYDNVKHTIWTWLKYTDIGPTKITVSTVGVLMQLERLLTDNDWPPVRIAVSLHSANQQRREEIVPTTVPDFLKKLADWSRRYATTKGNQRHHITFEYTLIAEVNDTPELAHELGAYVRKTGYSKVNVIPLNSVPGKCFTRSSQKRIDAFKNVLLGYGLDVMQRRTMGDDIAAACGQLITETAPGKIALDVA